eukprot:7845775-Pyramimonas_sp.AAC.1
MFHLLLRFPHPLPLGTDVVDYAQRVAPDAWRFGTSQACAATRRSSWKSSCARCASTALRFYVFRRSICMGPSIAVSLIISCSSLAVLICNIARALRLVSWPDLQRRTLRSLSKPAATGSPRYGWRSPEVR